MEENKIAPPGIGDQAPDFEAISTFGPINFSDFNSGSWVILFSHPGDFTPVCTTELSGFAQRIDAFKDLNTKIIGLSIDSIHSHVAWVNNVKKNSGVLFNFPIIADIDMKVSKLYGMIQENESKTSTVRSLFIIDPSGKIRLNMTYPLNVGRNMDEIIRALTALQIADMHSVSLPLNWQKGDKVIVAPPETIDDLNEREKSNYEMMDFYLAKKSL